jgi:hypothetical protein
MCIICTYYICIYVLYNIYVLWVHKVKYYKCIIYSKASVNVGLRGKGLGLDIKPPAIHKACMYYIYGYGLHTTYRRLRYNFYIFPLFLHARITP